MNVSGDSARPDCRSHCSIRDAALMIRWTITAACSSWRGKMFEGIFQPWHLIIIVLIILIVFGPGKLPELGSALGKGIREFKGGVHAGEKESPESSPATVNQSSTMTATMSCANCDTAVQSGQCFCAQCGLPVKPEA